jgi:hypothetical protein
MVGEGGYRKEKTKETAGEHNNSGVKKWDSSGIMKQER